MAIIEFNTVSEATAAKDIINGYTLDGRELSCRYFASDGALESKTANKGWSYSLLLCDTLSGYVPFYTFAIVIYFSNP